MLLCDFINQKIKELEKHYKSVEFDKAINVQLGKNSVSENYITFETEMLKPVREVNLSELESTTYPYKDNGTKVTFKVVPPKKRKQIDKHYYLLWI